MHQYRAPFRELDTFFAVRSWVDCITNMSGFDLRQAQVNSRIFVGLRRSLALPLNRRKSCLAARELSLRQAAGWWHMDGEGARSDGVPDAARPRRRGDRMSAVTSEIGTFRTSHDV